MEVKNNNKTVITGRSVCLIAGLLSALCAIYWIIKAIAFEETNLPAILSSTCIGLYLTIFARKR